MHLTHLSLKNFRNYTSAELTLGPGLTVFRGANAQGKSNLLEAVAMLALTKSTRAEQERDVVRLASLEDTPYTRVSGVAERRDGGPVEVQIDMAMAPVDRRDALVFQKRVRVDGVPKPAGQAVGAIAAVLFSADDLTIVTGSPSVRRRYLDVLLSLADRGYLRALQGYQRVITQRNQLLRRIRDGLARTPELDYWDGELCRLGAQVTARRRDAVASLAPEAASAYAAMAPGDGPFQAAYAPSIDHGGPAEEAAAHAMGLLAERRGREVQMAQSLVGPHRDDLLLTVGGLDVGQFGSRGQVRTAALSLRLAEAGYLHAVLGEEPVLLLDDVLSELDGQRRQHVLEAACRAEQSLVTVVEGEEPPGLHEAVATYVVEAGALRREG
ncbi:MAG: DNA replication/repair protein RecF [Chloroflexi bacterium]|nr:DNA replication/repair protein RecF [Chloroflexota bacterium]